MGAGERHHRCAGQDHRTIATVAKPEPHYKQRHYVQPLNSNFFHDVHAAAKSDHLKQTRHPDNGNDAETKRIGASTSPVTITITVAALALGSTPPPPVVVLLLPAAAATFAAT